MAISVLDATGATQSVNTLPATGQATKANSLPVTLASDQGALSITGALTDTQLRASAVAVTGPVTDAQLRASAISVTGPLTDAQLRASALPVSGPLTDAQLRASAVSVSVSNPQLPRAASATIMTCQTAATGTNWTAFDSQACTQLSVVNNSGTDLEVRRGGAGAALPILDRMAYVIIGITNANQISIRRVDQANDQVTLAAEALG